MFTDKEQISQYITSRGYVVNRIDFIDKGVMTDKYLVVSSGKRYIARCYPTGREWLAKVEFLYLNFFQPLGIKTPKPVFYGDAPALLFYEEIEGLSLDEVYEAISDEEKDSLCREILENYNKICKIETSGFGRITGYNKWSHTTWTDFINETVDTGYEVLRRDNHTVACDYIQDMRNSTSDYCHFKKSLVWSDFSKENIIVTHDHHLAGFVDLEGLIAGDPALGIGYLKAHDETDFAKRIIEIGYYDSDRTDFYAVHRYLGLLPYQEQALPNGAERTPIEEFLPYSHNTINQNVVNMNRITTHLKQYCTEYVIGAQLIICVIAFYFIPCLYEGTIEKSDISVPNKAPQIEMISESPSWFKFDNKTIHTNQAISDGDKQVLLSLVSHEDSLYQTYYKDIDALAYKSNNDTSNYWHLIFLTLCFITLGCIARSFYDFIGRRCYTDEGQDMKKWWPWYAFRPVIGVPIATFLIVAARTAMFSNIFTSRDLCTYLVISFLAGFSMMEFLKMLRRVSKALFGNDN